MAISVSVEDDKTLSEIQDEVHKTVDYEEIHRYMTEQNWKWSKGISGELEVPAISRMKRTVDRLVEDVIEASGFSRSATGGFEVVRYGWSEPVGTKIEVYFDIS